MIFRRTDSYQVARQVTEQVQQLGEVLAESKSIKALLWPAHDKEVLLEQWARFEEGIRRLLRPEGDPLALFTELADCSKKMRLIRSR